MVGNNFYDRSDGQMGLLPSKTAPPPCSYPKVPTGAPRDVRRRAAPGNRSRRLDPIRRVPNPRFTPWEERTAPPSSWAGRTLDTAYWYDVRIGHWVTSEYYTSAYPAWVQTFHRERRVESYFGTTWSPLPVSEALLSRMEIETADGWFSRAFGRASLYPNRGYYNAVFYSPFLESYLFDFAERLVTEEELGADDTTDVLALSFASVDTVGHGYGPNSRELLDTVLRLDRELGEFFTFLDETVGLDRVAVSLSADPWCRAGSRVPGVPRPCGFAPVYRGLRLRSESGAGVREEVRRRRLVRPSVPLRL